ncbi:hypothetical protein [Halosolutus gelatinilyticus]|uniref:hypothetical protein n=1 Tax=Halosolutus gelatinilyticus TaxID=2931975 RepID=UPI001FF6BB57|nr:hypothetical protein [Halosolutus gelatinilyticus]
MAPTPSFSDDDVGKRVETAAGEPIGVVKLTEDETAYVATKEGAIDAIRAAHDWDLDTEETVPIDAAAVDAVTAEAIHLTEAPFSTEGTDPVFDRDEGTGGQFVDGERRELGPGAGEPDADDLPEGEGRSGKGVQPETDDMQESGAERHPAEEEGDEPDDGERTVTTDRGRDDDR